MARSTPEEEARLVVTIAAVVTSSSRLTLLLRAVAMSVLEAEDTVAAAGLQGTQR